MYCAPYLHGYVLSLKYWRKKLRKTTEDGRIFHVNGWEELTLIKWLSHQDSIQSQGKYKSLSSQTLKTQSPNTYRSKNDQVLANYSWTWRILQEVPPHIMSNYNTGPLQLKHKIMKLNGGPKCKSMQLHLYDFWQNAKFIYLEKILHLQNDTGSIFSHGGRQI